MTDDNIVYRFDHPIGSAHLRAIGMVAVEAAYVEHVVEYAIWRLIDIDPKVGEVLTTRQNLETKLSTMQRVAHVKLPSREHYGPGIFVTWEIFDAHASRIREVSARRNDLLHSAWYPPQAGRALGISRKMDGVKGVREIVSEATSEEIIALAAELKIVGTNLLSSVWKLSVPAIDLLDPEAAMERALSNDERQPTS